MFGALLIANIGTLITEISANQDTSIMLAYPTHSVCDGHRTGVVPSSSRKGNYKLTQAIMLVASLFYIVLHHAQRSRPIQIGGWAVTNLLFPHGVDMTSTYLARFLLLGMGVLGTTIPLGANSLISSFAFDKKIEKGKITTPRWETYGAPS